MLKLAAEGSPLCFLAMLADAATGEPPISLISDCHALGSVGALVK